MAARVSRSAWGSVAVMRASVCPDMTAWRQQPGYVVPGLERLAAPARETPEKPRICTVCGGCLAPYLPKLDAGDQP